MTTPPGGPETEPGPLPGGPVDAADPQGESAVALIAVHEPRPAGGVDGEETLVNRSGRPDVAGSLRPALDSLIQVLPAADLVVAVFLSAFVFLLLNYPDTDGGSDLFHPLLFLDTTPSGGDMGAHVWGPAFLRDHILETGRLSGWTPDWYAGFPAFHFYMVVPALAIVAVNAGLPWFLGIPVAAAVLYGGRRLASRRQSTGKWIMAVAIVIAVAMVAVPYGVSFKLVSVAGLVMFPLAAWVMARLAGAPQPVPAFTAMAGFVFLFDTNFTIYGGNIASTLAGEFAFSISLCLVLVTIGMALRGMSEHKWRAPTALLMALVLLSHLIPPMFLIPALILAVLVASDAPRLWAVVGAIALALLPVAFAEGTSTGFTMVAIAAVVIVLVSAIAAEHSIQDRARWLLLAGPVSVLLTGFWLVPFYGQKPYFNDMGWERLEDVGPPLLTVPMKIALPVAVIGFIAAVANRERIGMIFGGTALLAASAVANIPEGPLWNARLLPFYYLSVYMTAAVGVAMVARWVAASLTGDLQRPDPWAMLGGIAAATVAVSVAVAMPLRIMPFGHTSSSGDGSYEWLAFTNQARSLVPGWADWNYSGYEEKPSYAEYRNVVATMTDVGREVGCGRAMWEYDKGLDRYGTPMALMLLPHWTDGCIGSMEGLYFESSATTPFHFLNQSVLSDSPSRAQRDLPYQGFDIDNGVAQLQVMGVRYYLAQSDPAIEAARSQPDLTEVAVAEPFVVFEVAGSELVQGLAVQPVVAEGRTADEVVGEGGDPEELSRFEVGWLSQAVTFYNDPASYPAMPAEDGPDGWTRQELLSPGSGDPVDQARVSDIDVGTDSIGFTVDKVGSPVLVKASYFPNWKADGADGPWRIGPNLMVVVPTEERVELSYGRTMIDWIGTLLSVLGIGGLVALGLVDRDRSSLGRRLNRRPVRVGREPAPADRLPLPPLVRAPGRPPATPDLDDAIGHRGDGGRFEPAQRVTVPPAPRFEIEPPARAGNGDTPAEVAAAPVAVDDTPVGNTPVDVADTSTGNGDAPPPDPASGFGGAAVDQTERAAGQEVER